MILLFIFQTREFKDQTFWLWFFFKDKKPSEECTDESEVRSLELYYFVPFFFPYFIYLT